MKTLFILSLMVSFTGWADTHDFNTAKTKMLSRLEQREMNIKSAKACVQKATTKEELKQCRKTLHQAAKKMKQEMKNERQSQKKK
jgi:histidinol phosphatase-like enzyme